MKLIVAIDFDNTIANSTADYVPVYIKPGAKEVINWAHTHGCYIIIWTCRAGKMLRQVIKFLKDNGVKYDKINENYPLLDFDTSRKIYYDVLIDDRNLGFVVDWRSIRDMLKQKLLQKLAGELIDLCREDFVKQASDKQMVNKIKMIWDYVVKNFHSLDEQLEVFKNKLGVFLRNDVFEHVIRERKWLVEHLVEFFKNIDKKLDKEYWNKEFNSFYFEKSNLE
jgi:hydroxymethylpyrimidine pyrophosphatase-like HAD family hydrolase